MTQKETHEIHVLDKAIHCAGCEARIQQVLARMPGVQEVEADHKTQKIQLTLASAIVSVQDVKGKLADLGYSTE